MSTTTTTEEMSIDTLQRRLLSVEKLRGRVRRILRCVINLHIDILVLESRVTQLIDDCRDINGDLDEVQRLDTLISTLRDYDGPTVCHEWPYPLIFKGTIDAADVAQILNNANHNQHNHHNNNNNNTIPLNKRRSGSDSDCSSDVIAAEEE